MPMSVPFRRHTIRTGFTLVEVLVTLAVIAVLFALAMPAIQATRASMRRVQCAANLRQLGQAMHQYHETCRVFPSGNQAGFSPFAAMLPYMDRADLFEQIDYRFKPEAPVHSSVSAVVLPYLLCPSDGRRAPMNPTGPSNYAASDGTGIQATGRYNGFFQIARPNRWGGGFLSAADITDGLSHTAAFSEQLIGDDSGAVLRTIWNVPQPIREAGRMNEFANACESLDVTAQAGERAWRGGAWLMGYVGNTKYNHVQTPNRRACYNATFVPAGAYPPVSLHTGGVNVCYGDGSVSFVSDSIDTEVWRAQGTRSSGDSVSGG